MWLGYYLVRLTSPSLLFREVLMKSKLAAIAALISIAFAGVPAFGQAASVINKYRVIGYYAKEECWIRNGLTKEKSDQRTLDYQKQYPELKLAIEWVLTSSDGKAAVKRISPFFDSDCRLLISDEEAADMIFPYVE